MKHHVKVLVYLKEGVLDTQGTAVTKVINNQGHEGVSSVRVGKYIQLWIEAESAETAREEAEKICEEILVNDLIEDFYVEVEYPR